MFACAQPKIFCGVEVGRREQRAFIQGHGLIHKNYRAGISRRPSIAVCHVSPSKASAFGVFVDPLLEGRASSSSIDKCSEHFTKLSGDEVDTVASELHGRIKLLSAAVDGVTAALGKLAPQSADSANGDNSRSSSTLAASSLESSQVQENTATFNGAVDVTKSVSCTVTHPGAVCCTTTTVSHDHDTGTCTVSLHTTAARSTADADVHRAVSDEELAALAATALESAAAAHAMEENASLAAHAQPADVAKRHAALCALLSRGDIVDARRNPVTSEFGHESFVLTLRNRETGGECRAIFKPKVQGDAGGWHRAPCEWVAYRLNVLLGLDLVPPCAYRSEAAGTGPVSFHLAEGDDVYFHEGALCYLIEDAVPLHQVAEDRWGVGVDKELLLSDTRVLDVLLHNSDRHAGHFLFGKHWAQGRWDDSGKWNGSLRPTLIDHAASFRAEACVMMTHDNAFCTGPVQRVRASTYLRLRFLDLLLLKKEFGQVLCEGEIAAMAARRDAVLRYLDGLVALKGYAAVVQE